MKQTNKEPKRGSLLKNFSDQFSRVPTNNNNKQVGVQLGLECHLIFNSLLLLSGVHGVGDGDCAVGRTKSILAKEKSSRAGLTEQVVGVDVGRVVAKSG